MLYNENFFLRVIICHVGQMMHCIAHYHQSIVTLFHAGI